MLTDYIAFDYKLVGVDCVNKQNMVACVSIVNSYGACIYDTYVKPFKEIIDYRTEITGITPAKLAYGSKIHKVKQEISSIIKGRVLIGHRIARGLKLLGLCHPEWNRRELTEYEEFEQSARVGLPSLRYLARNFLGIHTNIPETSLKKARLAMMLYKHVAEDWEEMLQNTDESDSEEDYDDEEDEDEEDEDEEDDDEDYDDEEDDDEEDYDDEEDDDEEDYDDEEEEYYVYY